MTSGDGAAPVDQTEATRESLLPNYTEIPPYDDAAAKGGDAVQREALKRYRQGWALVPLYTGSKRPLNVGWLQHSYQSEDEVVKAFWAAEPERSVAAPNLGVVLGQRSGRLVVVDLDAADPRIAALALPSTDLRDGRPSNPDSHWYYIALGKGELPKQAFKSPLAERPLIELLGDGQQAVLPPSLHPSGEERVWYTDGEAAEVDEDELRAAAGRAAAFQEIALVWRQLGAVKHDSALPLVGGLLRAGVEEGTIEALLDLIWTSADEGEVRNAVESTVRRRDEGAPYSGWRRLREYWPDFHPSLDRILGWLGAEGAEDERPVVVLSRGGMKEATREAWQALKQRNDPVFLFSQGTGPVRVETDDKGRAGIASLTPDRMRYHLIEEIRWLSPGAKGGLVPTDPTPELTRNVLAAPNAQLPPLSMVTVAPVLSPDGDVQTEPGYHAENQSYYQPLNGYSVPEVPASPTTDEVERAKALLLDEFLGGFPFETQAEKANALALQLLPFGRSVIAGPTPLHYIEAPKAGTGKSKLADLITRLVCGPSGAASITETTDEEEWRKRITATLATGSPFVFIDNITQTLQSSNLASALTKMQWKDRILGKSEQITLDIRVVWMVTANNASMNVDIARRSVRIRLNANVEDPYKRDPSSFRHPNLEAWVAEHWGELVWSCLTLWRAWVAAGKPRGKAVLGSFEEWAAVMSGVLDVAGVPGFLSNRDEFIDLAATDTTRWRDLIERWWERYGTDEVRPKDLYEQVASGVDGFEYHDKKEGGRITAFGMELRGQRDIVYGRFKVSVGFRKEKPFYSLVHRDGEKRTARDYVPEPEPGDGLMTKQPDAKTGVSERPRWEGQPPPFGGRQGSAS